MPRSLIKGLPKLPTLTLAKGCPMDAELVTNQAEQDQLWMAWDDWYEEVTKQEEFVEFVELLDTEEPNHLLKRIKKLDVHGIEVLRCLALHCLRELILRSLRDELKVEEDTEYAE